MCGLYKSKTFVNCRFEFQNPPSPHASFYCSMQLYLSEIPGRSIIYFERFDKSPSEGLAVFWQRLKRGAPQAQQYYFLHDLDPNTRKLMSAFAVKQNITFLKYHHHFKLSGVMELKICIHENSFVKLSHPSQEVNRVPAEVKLVLDKCFGCDSSATSEDTEEGTETEASVTHDIDKLYEEVKQHHQATREARVARVQVDPQHKSLIPKLRPYQAHAVRSDIVGLCL